jgi:hypothetical protein
MENELFSVEVLSTFAGQTGAVLAVVEAIKKSVEMFVKKKIDNRIWVALAMLTSFGISFGMTVVTAAIGVISLIFAFFNSFAIFGSATAGFRAAKEHLPNSISDKL